MCGIAGIFNCTYSEQSIGRIIENMNTALKHRGPDGNGFWVKQDGGLAFGHARLSILDLSDAAKQPMRSHSGRYVMTYNGEVFNFQSVAEKLKTEGFSFRSTGDTEVILAAFEAWGVEKAVHEFIGMFAIGLYDLQEKRLYLIRDRFGIKPLYYSLQKQTLAFASELKPLRVIPDFQSKIDRTALGLYFKYCYVPAPYSIYSSVKKVMPGSILHWDLSKETPRLIKEELFYDKKAKILEAESIQRFADTDEYEEALESLLTDAVKLRTISDVNIGAFLSGGIDSSLVVALMQKVTNKAVKTFTIGFDVPNYNESVYAREVSRAIGTDHTELILNPNDALELVPELPIIYDEPFADSSQLPTTIVSRLAREQVTVSLSGDGGDEFFGGYNRYFWSEQVWKSISRVPFPMRKVVAKCVTSFSPASYDKTIQFASKVSGINRLAQQFNGNRIHKVAGLMGSQSSSALYESMLSLWNPSAIVMQWSGPKFENKGAFLKNNIEQMMYHDTETYLPDDILVKVDRASMSTGLEARVPLLDHRVFEMAWSLPLQAKVAGGSGKLILKKILEKHVPKNLIDRPKMGFGVPIEHWLRHELKDWAAHYLEPQNLNSLGLNALAINSKWKKHLSGAENNQYLLWPVLVYCQWADKNMGTL